MAVFEITTSTTWSRSLLPRLEERLLLSLERARNLPGNSGITSVLHVVAVVGVVGVADCKQSVAKRVTAARHPLLHTMMREGRFVFIRLELLRIL
jgi:hypothetical protein